MKQAQKPGKRIVSKGAYVRSHLFRVSGKSAGIVVQAGGVVWAVLAPFQFYEHFEALQHYTDSPRFFPADILMATIVGMGWMIVREVGRKVVQHSDKIDAGVPLTRANTADLSANDTLVRASDEPIQAQEAVLLRAATAETQEENAAQLLRAAAGGQE